MSMGDEKQCEMRNRMLLFGLLIRKLFDEEKGKLLQRLVDANSEITVLKKVRNEDAKANEKVVSIIASQKQNWLKEKCKLRLQTEALMKELRNMEKRKRKILSDLQERLIEMEDLVHSKDKEMEQEKRKCEELEERLVKAEKEVRDLRETQERDVQEHSSELWRQKKTFLELASSQRQLEAELSRANKQIEARRQELEEMTFKIVKMQNEMEQKDRILAVMLKKSKLDMTEKHTLLKEAKLKQDEDDAKKWRTNSKSRKQERRSLRSMFAFEATNKSKTNSFGSATHIDPDLVPEIMDSISVGDLSELGIASKRENLIFGEEELCIRVIGKQEIELGDFTEQIKLKDERVEALCWHLMNSELESKRLRSCIEGLRQEMSELRHNNIELEGLVSRKRNESVVVKKQQFKTQLKNLISHKSNTSCKIKNTKTEPREEQEKELKIREGSQENATEKGRESYSPDELRHLTLKAAQSDAEEESEKNILLPKNESTKREKANGKESESLEKQSSTSNPPWRMDLHALGVSFKIKRLKQQLMMLERYIGKQESQEIGKSSSDTGKRALILFITFLNKQVTRYQSLQEKIDDLCKRMHVNDLEKIGGKTKADGEAKISLEQFLDETFQLQRYIVATGQKLMEIQSKIASGFVEALVDLITTESSSSSSSFDPERFAESIRSLFEEVQRGLEVRISRTIGDLEGTLAREGMIHLKQRDHCDQRV